MTRPAASTGYEQNERMEESDNSDENSEGESGEENGKNHRVKKRDKKAQKQQAERGIEERERKLMKLGKGEVAPESAEDYERLLLAQPNSSLLWIRYMTHHLRWLILSRRVLWVIVPSRRSTTERRMKIQGLA